MSKKNDKNFDKSLENNLPENVDEALEAREQLVDNLKDELQEKTDDLNVDMDYSLELDDDPESIGEQLDIDADTNIESIEKIASAKFVKGEKALRKDDADSKEKVAELKKADSKEEIKSVGESESKDAKESNDSNDSRASKASEEVRKNSSKKSDKTAENSNNKLSAKNRKVRNTSVVSLIVFAAILLVANIMLEQIGGKHLKFDWTQNKVASIGQKSKDILASNDKAFNITVLSSEDEYSNLLRGQIKFMPQLLKDYEKNAKGNLSLTYIDPVQDPSIITKLDPNNFYNLVKGQMVISNEDNSKIKVVNPQDLVETQYSQYGQMSIQGYSAEEKISGAIKFVTAEFTPKVVITTGHNETPLDKGFSALRDTLENNNFKIEEFSSTTSSEIPADTELLLMINPQNDINPLEVEAFMNYLKTGGSLMVMADYSTADFKNLNKVLEEFNLRLSNDMVKENKTDLVAANAGIYQAEILSGTIYPDSIPLNNIILGPSRVVTSADNAREYVSIENILETSDEATKLIAGSSDNESQASKLSIGMYSKHSGWIDMKEVKDPAQVTVYGSAMIFSDQYLLSFGNSAGNSVLAYYSIAQMADLANNQAEDLLIETKPVVSYQIMPKSQNNIQIAIVLLSFVVPFALLVIAYMVNKRRSNL